MRVENRTFRTIPPSSSAVVISGVWTSLPAGSPLSAETISAHAHTLSTDTLIILTAVSTVDPLTDRTLSSRWCAITKKSLTNEARTHSTESWAACVECDGFIYEAAAAFRTYGTTDMHNTQSLSPIYHNVWFMLLFTSNAPRNSDCFFLCFGDMKEAYSGVSGVRCWHSPVYFKFMCFACGGW